jgi:hypothetical protein
VFREIVGSPDCAGRGSRSCAFRCADEVTSFAIGGGEDAGAVDRADFEVRVAGEEGPGEERPGEVVAGPEA